MSNPFPEPNWNHLTPGKDENLAHGNESVDRCVNDDSPSNNSEVIIKVVIHLKKENTLLLKTSFILVLSHSVHNVEK